VGGTSLVLDHFYNSLADARAVAQPVLNLPQLDAKAPELDLVVQTPQELNHPLRQPAR